MSDYPPKVRPTPKCFSISVTGVVTNYLLGVIHSMV
jgi:hypothetical protein